MPRYLFTLLLCVFSLSAFAQIVAIQNDKQNILYTCIDNPITVAVSNVRPTDIILTIDSGSVLKDEYAKPGHYNINTRKIGGVVIYVSKKTKQGIKLIDSVYFRVKRFPHPEMNLMGKTNGKISKSALCMTISPRADVVNFDIDAKMPVKEFTINVYRNTKQIFTRNLRNEKGARIDSLTNDFFTTLENGDSVVFNNFIVADCSGERTDVNSLEFTITEAENYHKPPPHKPGDIDPVTGEPYIKEW